MAKSTYIYDILAVAIVAVWGMTFISSTVLLEYFSPAQLFALRFSIAYLGMWLFSHDHLLCGSVRDELLMLAAGVTGGSLYFLAENTALELTVQTSAVSFIVCTTPLVTAILSLLLGRSGARLSWNLALGSALSLGGVAMIVLNGSSLFGGPVSAYLLAVLASFTWASYTLIVDSLQDRYPSAFITRKVFFWGLVTILPVLVFQHRSLDLKVFGEPVVILNIAFLAIVASLVCYALWNPIIRKLGTIRSSNYIYLNPLFTFVGSMIFLNEPINWISVIGSLMTLGGVIVAGLRTSSRG